MTTEATAAVMAKEKPFDVVEMKKEITRQREIFGKRLLQIVDEKKGGQEWMIILSDLHSVMQQLTHILKHLEKLQAS